MPDKKRCVNCQIYHDCTDRAFRYTCKKWQRSPDLWLDGIDLETKGHYWWRPEPRGVEQIFYVKPSDMADMNQMSGQFQGPIRPK